jgi:hypothetical protein
MSGVGGRLVAGAVATLVLVAASGVLLIQVLDGARSDNDDGDGVHAQYAGAEGLSVAVVDALRLERDRSALDLSGGAGFLPSSWRSSDTVDELRDKTDRSISVLTTWLGGASGGVAALYRPGLDHLDGLAALRDEIDAHPTPGSLADAELSSQVFDRYSELLATLDDAAREGLPLSTDDPRLSQGLLLADTASRQDKAIGDLVRLLLLAGASGSLDQSGEITQLSRAYAEFTRNAETIDGIDRSPYREIVEHSPSSELDAAVAAAVEPALAGGTIDIPKVLALTQVPPDQSYIGLYDQTQDAVRQDIGRVRDDRRSTDRAQLISLVALVITGLLAGLALVATIVTAVVGRPASRVTGASDPSGEGRGGWPGREGGW